MCWQYGDRLSPQERERMWQFERDSAMESRKGERFKQVLQELGSTKRKLVGVAEKTAKFFRSLTRVRREAEVKST